ncbi:unnamed protein product [Schistocephalus solidus]|uniref:Septin-type G domain-containing protein n=1 Tax=Schistocephalus solidus TaxID=70667 RepID=A0A183TRU2_SCHSO|nr:unnamed protein product [Schistocephalus solidus]
MTLEECKEFKKNLLADFQHHKIKIYDFPDSEQNFENSNDEEGSRLRRLRDRMPFAVVGANTYITNSAGVKVRARTYPWGTVEVDNVEHNDFSILRYFLIRLQMQVGSTLYFLRAYSCTEFNRRSGKTCRSKC